MVACHESASACKWLYFEINKALFAVIKKSELMWLHLRAFCTS